MQSGLTGSLGTLGATQVRFLYGFPFALLFLLIAMAATHSGAPAPKFSLSSSHTGQKRHTRRKTGSQSQGTA